MKNLTKRAKIIMIVLLAAFLALCAAVGGYFIVRENRLNELQKDALEELEANRGEYAEQTIVLRDTSFGEANALAKKYGATLRITSDGKFATLKLPAGVTIEDIYAERANRGDLPKLSADYYTRTSELEIPEDETPEHLPTAPSTTPSDPDFTLQSYINYLHLGETWNYTQGNGITIAVIDTGIDTDHPEFKGKISEYSYNATTDEVLKDTAPDGSDDYDWSLIEDEQGHGTAVAGTIAAAWNEDGIAGIAPNVTLLVIKAECSANGVFVSTSDLVFGLYYAVERDADIVNMSFGIVGNNPFESATRLAVDSDVVCVAAAGNESTAALTYPAADKNVIGVGALAENSWELADYSNYGENVDMVAPGTVYTTKMDGSYGTMEGTSFASPVTAGALALYLSQYRYQMFEDVEEVLFAACYDLGGLGKDFTYGYGALDVNALVVEEKGTVTFDMLTDELENTEQIFVRNHTLQNLPEPERNYAVFDGWYYDIHCTEELNWYEDAFSKDLTLYANWVNEDDGVPYTYVRVEDGIEIQSYTGKRRYITIPDEIEETPVVSIGDFAFANETRLRLVNLPATLRRIGQGAFQNCNNLLEITVPDSVTTIGSYAFQNNIRLASVYFSGKSTLTSIGSGAFSNCSSLTRFSVPTATISLDGSAFMGTTSMRAFSVGQGNTAFSAKDGVLFTRSMNTLIAYPAGLTAETYSIPDGVRELGAYSFAFAKISNVELEGIARIGEYTFTGSRLEQVTIPDSVTAMGVGAFSDCTYLSNVTLGHGLDTISVFAFTRCAMLESIQIPQEVTIIDGSAFATSGLKAVEFAQGSNLVIIGGGAFAQTQLTSIHLPVSLMVIGDDAFYKAALLAEVVFDGSDLQTIGDEAFRDTASLQTITLPENLRSLGAYSFMNSGLREVALPASLTELGEGAFAECHDLININVQEENTAYKSQEGVVYNHTMSEIVAYPAGNARTEYAFEKTVTTIGSAAFYGAWNLQSVTLPQELVTVGEYGFYDCTGMTSYTLPQTLESIEEYAFSLNTSLSMMEIPNSVTHIARFAFAEDYALQTITFGEESQLPRIGYAAFAYTGITSFRVPKNVSTIGQEAFAGSKNLTSLTFAKDSKLDIIPAYFLKGSEQIRYIIFENGSALTSIAAHGFEGMRNLYSIDFGNAELKNIDNFAFRYDANLSSITLPETVTDIGRYAFYGCNALTRLEIPESVEHIGTYAFYGAENLDVYFKAETLPLYLQENWDEGIRGYYVGVNEVTSDGTWRYATLKDGTVSVIEYLGAETTLDLNAFPYGKVSSIGGNAFAYSDVESVTLPKSLTSIQAYAFAYSKLKQIIIPASVEFIGKNAFYNTPITSVEFANESTLKVIEQYAFALTKSLTSVTVPASVVTMGTGVFSESGIQSVIFPEESVLTELPAEAFYSTKLVSVNLPDSIVYIGDNAFRNTETLQKVTFGKGKDLEIRANAFYNTGLTELTIPANVEYIGEYAFVGLQNLENFVVDGENPYYSTDDKGVLYNKDKSKLIAVPAGMVGTFIVPATVETIGFGAFENSALTGIDFSNVTNLLTFGYRAFYNMQSLTEFTVPASVVSIDYYAFALCSALERVNFADGNRLAGIYEGAFYGCTSLKDIELPDSIVEISDYAFYGCSSLTKIPVSETSELKGIYDYAFAYTGITELVIPESVIDIGAYAFRGAKLKTLTIPDENKLQLIIGIGAFADCSNLTEVTLPFIGASFEDDEITWLGYIFGAGSYEANATYTPAALKTVTIAEGITKIGHYAFYELANLQAVNVPHTVTMVGYDSFADCPARYELTNIFTPNWLENDSWYIENAYLSKNYFGRGIAGTLEISEGIKTFGWDIFEDCTYLEKIILPNSLEDLGYDTFRNCGSLREVIFPQNLSRIPNGAFHGCVSLSQIDLPKNLTSIGADAFSECVNLENITIPRNVVELEDSQLNNNGVFFGCTSLKTVSFETGSLLKNIGDFAFNYCPNLENINIPKNVERIGIYAFNGYEFGGSIGGGFSFSGGSNLRSVTFEDGSRLETISSSAFLCNNNLVVFEVPNSLKEIGYEAFKFCYALSTFTLPENLTDIGRDAFEGCTHLYKIVNHSDLELEFGKSGQDDPTGGIAAYAKVIIDKEQNTRYKTGTQEIIETTDGFRFIKEEENYKLVSYYGEQDTVVLPKDFNGKNYDIYELSGVKNVVIPDGMESISASAFYGNPALVSVHIPLSVTKIGSYAFANCINLPSIAIPNSVIEIEYRAFSGCSKLKSVVLSNALGSISLDAFADCTSLLQIEIPEGITEISSGAFSGCTSLSSVSMPSTLESWADTAFTECPIQEFVIDEKNNNFVNEGGLIMNKEKTSMLLLLKGVSEVRIPATIKWFQYVFSENKDLVSVSFEEGSQLEFIGVDAFSGCSNLRYIEFPTTITEIRGGAFRDCSSLESIDLSSNIQLTQIGLAAFKGCVSLKHVILPSSLSQIDGSYEWGAFQDCSSLQDVTIESNSQLTTISDYTFNRCTSLRSIELGENSILSAIGMSAFGSCSSLEKIELPNTLTSIGIYAFFGCSKLKELYIPADVSHIGDGSFSGCDFENLEIAVENQNYSVIDNIIYNYAKTEIIEVLDNVTVVHIPDEITTIKSSVFRGMTSLRLVEFTETSQLRRIEEFAFYNCYNLDTFTIPSLVEYIDPNAFGGCKIEIITNKSEVTVTLGVGIAENASLLIDKLGNKIYSDGIDELIETEDHFIFIKEGKDYRLSRYVGNEPLIHLPDNILGFHYSMKEVKIPARVAVVFPDWVTEVSPYTFEVAPSKVIFGENSNLTKIDDNAFYGCANLSTVEFLGSCLKSIGNSAFEWSGIEHITIPNGVEEIGSGAFGYCMNLHDIQIPASVKTMGGIVFWHCSNLEEVLFDEKCQIIDFEGRVNGGFSSSGSGTSAPFEACERLSRITLPSGLTKIPASFLDDTEFYKNPTNWLDGVLYVGNHLIRVKEDARQVSLKKDIGAVADDAFEGCYLLKRLAIGGSLPRALSPLSNLETLIITDMPQHDIYDYFGYYSPTTIPMTLKNIILKKGIKVQTSSSFSYFLASIINVNVYVEAEKDSVMWDHDYPNWANGNKVYYGGEWISAEFFGLDGELIDYGYYTTSQIIRQPYVSPVLTDDSVSQFVGWDLDNDGEADFVPATSITNIVAHAVLVKSERLYHVNFADENGHVYESHELHFNEAIPEPATPEKHGYTFIEWDGYASDMVATKDVTFYAVWSHNGEHNYQRVHHDATCTEWGYDEYTCSVCGESYSEISKDEEPTGHSFEEWVVTQTASCETAGSHYRDCKNCQEREVEEIAPTGHSFTREVKREATCEEEGEVTFSCENCDLLITEPLSKTAHHYEKKYVSKTFLQWLIDFLLDAFFGYDNGNPFYYQCTECGQIQTRAEANRAGVMAQGAHIHTLGEWSQELAPTCSEYGVLGARCIVCEQLVAAKQIDMVEHQYSDQYEVDEAPTCTENGKQSHHCIWCGISDGKYETIPATGHNFDEGHVQAKDPTCTESGNFEYYHCATCDRYFKDAQGNVEYGDQEWIRAATGHHYNDDWKQTKAPTYTEKGTDERSCTVCGERETRDVPALGLAQKFKDEVALIESATTSEQKFDAIKRAAETWNGLSEEERAKAQEAYVALKSAMENYNAAVEAVNDAYDSAFKTAISVMSTALAAASALAAVWFVRRKFH